jgi:hypothetical protein
MSDPPGDSGPVYPPVCHDSSGYGAPESWYGPLHVRTLNILPAGQVLPLNLPVREHHPDDFTNISAVGRNLLIRVFVPLMAGQGTLVPYP